MKFYFLIGYRECKLNEILIRGNYILIGLPINLTTDIVPLVIDLLDGKDIKNHWNLRVSVPNKHSSSKSLILLLVSLSINVFITDSVLTSI